MKKNSSKKNVVKKVKVSKGTSLETKEQTESKSRYIEDTQKIEETNNIVISMNINQVIQDLDPSKLQQAMILSEIIGDPVSRRRGQRGIRR